MECPNCQRTTEHVHLHDTAHGLPGTHMVGTERYKCTKCGYSMRRAEGEEQGLKFVLDAQGGGRGRASGS